MDYQSNRLSELKINWQKKLEKIYPTRDAKQLINLLILNKLKLTRSEQALQMDYRISESEMVWFHQAIEQLRQEKPLEYILERAQFYGMPLKVNHAVLIPRPETEELVELILHETKQKAPSIIDLGTGSGCIALALKKHLPQANVKALDISQEALEIAKKNARALSLDVDFFLCNMLQLESCSFKDKFDVIVSNPPYVTPSDRQIMQKNVLEYEPSQALFVTNADPLQFYRPIAQFALQHLNQQGKLYVEINEQFGEECASLFQQKGLESIQIQYDIHGKQRFISAVKP
jgi:release factor glutamine methyltransferase